jgi:predicted metalloprotease with PDZ domain
LSFLSPGGIGGHVSVQLGFGKLLHVGSASLSPPLFVRPNDAKAAALHAAGLLGVGILSQFIVTIDTQSMRAYFEPVAGRTLPTVLHGTGIIFDKPDHEAFEVVDTLKGSAAERAGVHPGDRILEIDGRAARDLSLSDAQSLNSSTAHTSVTVRTSDRRVDLAIGQILP